MSRHAFPIQPLLFWQSLTLFWFCGLLAAKYPLAGSMLALIIIIVDRRLWRCLALLVALSIFLGGFFAISLNSTPLSQKPITPAWTVRNNNIPIPVRIQGKIQHIQSLPDKRLRIFLKDVHMLNKASTHTLTGLVVWTWEHTANSSEHFLGQHRPLVGQDVQITAKIMSTEGNHNFHNSNIGAYWHDQKIFWRIWSQDNKGRPKFLGTGTKFARMREYVRTKYSQTITHAIKKANPYYLNESITQPEIQAFAFLPALLLYERYALTQDTLEKMKAVSLYHSLALSGQHLTFIIFYAIFIVYCIRFIMPQCFLYIPSPKLVAILSFPLALLYLWLGNAPISLIRASIMLFVGSIFFFKQRVTSLTHLLLYTALLITIYYPASFYNVGLQLSVLCVASICLMLPFVKNITAQNFAIKATPKKNIPRHIRFLRKIWLSILQLFWISLGIQITLLPIFLLYFPPTGLWFICNIIWLPILGIYILPLGALALLCAVCSLPETASLILNLAAFPCELLLHSLQAMQSAHLLSFPALMRPHFSATLALALLVLAITLLVGRTSWHHIKNGSANIPLTIRKLCFIGALLLCIAPILRYAEHWQNRLEVTLLDIGQGLAMHIKLPGGHTFMVDCGGSKSMRFDPGTALVLPSITYNKAPRLWAMFNTHPDIDHLRGLLHILPKVNVKHFYHNGTVFSPNDQKHWDNSVKNRQHPTSTILHAGMEVSLPSFTGDNTGYTLEILSPKQNATYEKPNNASLIIRFVRISDNEKKTRKGLILICGDAEKEALQDLLQSGQDLQADILIVPHHGSKDALLPEFYKKVAPKLALVSAGRQNYFGHPHEMVQHALKSMNIPLKNTAVSGAIKVRWDENEYSDWKFTVITAR